ncbi:MAG: acyl-CoA/acyl-ACP dehydrogenase [Chloroflexi bacterium]|nr:acyl-CoA/acyl-ACP dehydrogenase [Chloroflexota bacterium]
MDFTLPEELIMTRNLIRDFINENLLPIEKEVEENDEFPEPLRRSLKAKAVKLGLWALFAPRKYGGAGFGALGRIVVCEELGRVSNAVGYQGGIIGGPRVGWWGMEELNFATEEQKEKYILPMVRGEKERFGAMTEPNAGSDLANMETRAVKDGDSYILNGSKIFITGVDSADFGLTFAVTDWEKRARGGITAFLLDKDAPGFTYRPIPVMGRRGLHVYEVFYNDCRVPAKNILGRIGEGFKLAEMGLVTTRINCSAAVVGMAQRALDMAKSHAKQRVTFGETLSRRQLVQEKIIDAETELLASRLMLYNLAWEYEQGMDVVTKTFMVKTWITETACKIIDQAIQIHGGYGYTRELPLEMIYRDARLFRIGDGASEVLKWVAARRLLRD